MTVQLEDLFFWNNEEWVFISDKDSDKLFGFYELKEYELFKPEKYGLNVKMASTDCRKGFVIELCVKENKLFLKNLWVNCKDDVYPEINGIKAKYIDYFDKKEYHNYAGFYVYKNILERLYFSGKIIIGQEPEKGYIGYTVAFYKYNKIFKLVFENGVLQSFCDVSRKPKEK